MSAIPRSAKKILSRADAQRRVRQAQRRGERVVFTNGCFDLVHAGHVDSLERARAHGDRLVVALNSDASVMRLKGPGRPIVTARQRARVIAALECVDWVVIFRQDTPLSTILALRPDVLAKGGDWARSEIVGGAEVEGWGGKVVRLREIPGIRTSILAARAAVSSGGPPRRDP